MSLYISSSTCSTCSYHIIAIPCFRNKLSIYLSLSTIDMYFCMKIAIFYYFFFQNTDKNVSIVKVFKKNSRELHHSKRESEIFHFYLKNGSF